MRNQHNHLVWMPDVDRRQEGCLDPITFMWRTAFNYLVGNYLNKVAKRPVRDPEMLKKTLRELIIPASETKENDDGELLSFRDRCWHTIDEFCTLTGMVPYYVQMSSTDQETGQHGSRIHMWPEDFTIKPQMDAVNANHVLILIDVDGYMNMNEFLASRSNPVIICTFQPRHAAYSNSKFDYRFDENNELIMRFNSGQVYKHPVYNYSVPCTLVSKGYFLIPWRSTIYLTETLPITEDKHIILFAPVCTWRWPITTILSKLYERRRLEFIRPVQGKYVRLEIRGSKPTISTAILGDTTAATIPVATDNYLRAFAETGTTKIAQFNIMPVLQGTEQHKEFMAGILANFYTKALGLRIKPPTLMLPDQNMTTFELITDAHRPDSKPSMDSFCKPLLFGAVVPVKSLSSDISAVDGRVVAFQRPPVPITPEIDDKMKEFVKCLIKQKRRTLRPLGDLEVQVRQNTPTQRRILDKANGATIKNVVSSFVKSEPYPAVKPTRLISTIEAPTKRNYASIIYAIQDIAKDWEIYGFKSPIKIARRVAKLCKTAKNAAITDFSKFDGRITEPIRYLERHFLLELFEVEFHDFIIEQHNLQFCQKGRTKYGVKYDTGFARLSGSPETSIFNTITNAFVAFLAYSNTPEGMLRTSEENFQLLGVYGGDDGLTTNVNKDIYESAANSLGLKLDIQILQRGELGIKFLSRCYMRAVWNGDPNSCCSLERTLTRINLAPNMNGVTPRRKLKEKFWGLRQTDYNTPIVGELLHAYYEKCGGENIHDPELDIMMKWNSDYTNDEQYPNRTDEDMWELLEKEVPGLNLYLLKEFVDKTKHLDEFLNMPLLNTPVQLEQPEQDHLINGNTLLKGKVHPLVDGEERKTPIPAKLNEPKADQVRRLLPLNKQEKETRKKNRAEDGARKLDYKTSGHEGSLHAFLKQLDQAAEEKKVSGL